MSLVPFHCHSPFEPPAPTSLILNATKTRSAQELTPGPSLLSGWVLVYDRTCAYSLPSRTLRLPMATLTFRLTLSVAVA